MKVSYLQNSPSFNSHCPDIRLGQHVCNTVNKEFPHYYFTKFLPMMRKNISRTSNPSAFMQLIMRFNECKLNYIENSVEYFNSLFEFINKFKCFNCGEAGQLAELILKLNGIKNACTALIYDGNDNIHHEVCLFNRDGSEYNNVIKNRETIIVDPYTGICDFANNYFKQLGEDGVWKGHFKIDINDADKVQRKYNLRNVRSRVIPEDYLDYIKMKFPKLELKNIPQKKG